MVLGTVVAQSNALAWTGIAGMAFDGFRLHAMDYAGLHHVINRQNFAMEVPNQILMIAVLPAMVFAHGLAFDGKYFWTINKDTSPDQLMCYKLNGAVNPQLIKSFTLTDDNYNGVTFDGKNLVASTLNNITFWNPQTGVLVDFFALAFTTRDLTFDGKYLWVCDGNNNIIYCINPVSETIINSFGGPAVWPWGITFDGKYLWIGTWPNGAGTIYCVEKS